MRSQQEILKEEIMELKKELAEMKRDWAAASEYGVKRMDSMYKTIDYLRAENKRLKDIN